MPLPPDLTMTPSCSSIAKYHQPDVLCEGPKENAFELCARIQDRLLWRDGLLLDPRWHTRGALRLAVKREAAAERVITRLIKAE